MPSRTPSHQVSHQRLGSLRYASVKGTISRLLMMAILAGLASGQQCIPVAAPDNSQTTLPDIVPQPRVVLETTAGQIVLELFPQQAPIAVENFLTYVRSGFYNNTLFHDILSGQTIIAGAFTADLTRKDVNDPITNESNNGLQNLRGRLAVYEPDGTNSGTSQFLINLSNNGDFDFNLETGTRGLTVFGKIVEGLNVADAIGAVETESTTAQDGSALSRLPVQTILITSATIANMPTAYAGPDQTVELQDTVALDGSGSTPSVEGNTLTFSWQQTDGPSVTLDDPTSATPQFLADSLGTVTFELTVTENDNSSATDTVTIEVVGNLLLIADAGDNMTVKIGSTVTLDGSGSYDQSGDAITYAWKAPNGITLSDATAAQPTFTASDTISTLEFELTVRDSKGDIAVDTVIVTVVTNLPPIADAGADQVVNGGDMVILDGTLSTDPDGDPITYSWEQVGLATIALIADTVAQAVFTAPDASVTLTFQLTVTDDKNNSDTDTVTIVVNMPPTVVLTETRKVVSDVDVTLDASGSTDPDDDPLTYSWTQTAGTSVTLADDQTSTPKFTVPDTTDDLTFEVSVSDGQGGTSTATTTLTPTTAPRVRLDTTLGDVVLEILLADAPITSLNFLQYVEDGFYNETIFHRVIADFVVQGGGFLTGLAAQEGVRDTIQNEFSADRSNIRGTVAMAKVGGDPDSASSQFFFNLADNSANLDDQNGGFTVFARVTEGLDIVDAMGAVQTETKNDPNGTPVDDVPVDDIIVTSATIE